MKNILAVTACLKRCSIAISYEDGLYECNENSDASSNLVWLADNLIKSNNVNLKKIDGIITAAGPGSFTGIRVAQSFAKGLALSLKLPSVSVNYFDAIREIYSGSGDPIAVIKSEKGQVYYQINGKIGISNYELFADNLENEFILAGDAINEIIPHLKNKTFKAYPILDFRNAKYLLNFSNRIGKESQIRPLYMETYLPGHSP
ncbi:MAG: tRNA (adenosine(37)-N6)-threonylcarbamoyltransferase complex dimerization subunit type 1 TsaB [Holosporaceae bacterium]|jgi:tRNA threonylcarbamoyl adenosine modification protein YeaZ|nr:tRNA (adenosine(37)-N6)-threonylcarbamoyltransferase complex dimerization subunit type 1 TsaB [Holosporaceae bacterium]